jgi:ribosomal protein L1
MSAHGKQYRNARAAFDREQEYSPVEAITLLKDMQTAQFDETVEVHFRLGLNVRHADEQLRGTLMLPHGTGKEAKVAVFAEGDKAREAQEAGRRHRRRGRPRQEARRGRASPSSTSRSRRRTDGQRRQARSHPRPARADAEPEDGHR